AEHVGLGARGALADLDQAAVGGAATAAGHRLGDDVGRGVRGHVDHLGARVLVLSLAGEGDGQGLALGVLAHEVDGRVLHRHLGADVAVDPLHGRALVGHGALGDQVVDVVRPVLDGRVAAAGVLLDDDLDDRGVQRVRLVDRRGAALDVVHVGTLVDDDQGPLELAHVLGVDPEVGLERDLHVHALRHVDEGAAGPHGRVQRGELVVTGRDDRAEVLLEELGVLLQGGVGGQEDDALLLQVLTDLVVDDLRLVLRGDTGDQALLLRLRDAQLVVGVLDVLGQVLPGLRLPLRGAHEVLDVVEVDARQVRAPVRHGLLLEQAQALEAELGHPLRLVLLRRDVLDDVLVETTLGSSAGLVGVGPAVLVLAQAFELGVGSLRGESHAGFLPDVLAGAWWEILGMYVVQTPSPWAMVASRCTCVPRSSAKNSVSASHSCGNCSAAWAMGQWCWQSCSPTGALRAVAAYPSALRALASASVRSSGGAASTAARYASAWAAIRARANAVIAKPPPSFSPIQRSASTASLS